MFSVKSKRTSEQCVQTVVRALKRYYLDMHLCSECVLTMVASDYRMERKDVEKVWLANLDQVPGLVWE